jgi:hypothetical protein
MHKQFKVADITDTRTKQRVVTEFPTAKDVSPIEIHRHLNSVCVWGEYTVTVSTVRLHVRDFKSDATDQR